MSTWTAGVRGCDAAMLIVALEMAVMATAFVLEAMAGPQEREERRRLVFISPSLRSLASQLLLPAFHVHFAVRQNSNDRRVVSVVPVVAIGVMIVVQGGEAV